MLLCFTTSAARTNSLDPAILAGIIGAIAAIIGALIGGVGAVLGGLAGAQLVGERDEQGRKAQHIAAVRVVYVDLINNLAQITLAEQRGSAHGIVMNSRAYEAVLMPFYAYLPEPLATAVSYAYDRIAAAERRLDHVSYWDLLLIAREPCSSALAQLREYSRTRLRVDLGS